MKGSQGSYLSLKSARLVEGFGEPGLPSGQRLPDYVIERVHSWWTFLIGLRERIRGHSNSCGAWELSESCARNTLDSRGGCPYAGRLYFQIDVLNVFDCGIRETLAQAAEVFKRL